MPKIGEIIFVKEQLINAETKLRQKYFLASVVNLVQAVRLTPYFLP